MKKIVIGIIGICLLAGFTSGYWKKSGDVDLISLIKRNVPMLNEFEVANSYQKKGESRLYCAMLNRIGSHVTVEAKWRDENYKFNPLDRQSWFSFGERPEFKLGESESVSGNSHNIIGRRCEIVVFSTLRSSDGYFDRDADHKFVASNAPKIYALLQFQALSELQIAHDYRVLERNVEFEQNSSVFTVSIGGSIFRACLGSKDLYKNGKRVLLQEPVLMNEIGEILVTSEFLALLSDSN